MILNKAHTFYVRAAAIVVDAIHAMHCLLEAQSSMSHTALSAVKRYSRQFKELFLAIARQSNGCFLSLVAAGKKSNMLGHDLSNQIDGNSRFAAPSGHANSHYGKVGAAGEKQLS